MNSNGLTTARVCELAGISESLLHVWAHRGIFQPPPGKPGVGRDWQPADAFAVALLALLMRENKSLEQAAGEAACMVAAIGDLLRQALSDSPPEATRVAFVDVVLTDGERWQRLATTDRDLEVLFGAALRRGLVEFRIRDITASYVAVMEAFAEARSTIARRRADKVPA